MRLADILKICKNNKYINIIELLGNRVLYSSNFDNIADLKMYNISIADNCGDEFTYMIYYHKSEKLYGQALGLLEGKKFEIVHVHSKTKYRHYKVNNIIVYLSDNVNQEYLVIKIKKDIYIVSKRVDESRCLLYVIREIIRIINENKGNIIMHAGCIKHKNQNILIVGDSGDGKTTLIFQLLDKAEFEFVANDRTLIDRQLRVFEYPIKIRVGIETINNIKTLSEYMMLNGINKVENKVILYPIDVKRWKIQRNYPIDKINKIIIPNLNPDIKNNIEKLDKDAARIILERNCYALYDPEWINRWFVEEYFFKEEEILDNQKRILKNLLGNVEVYKLNYNGIIDDRTLKEIVGDR